MTDDLKAKCENLAMAFCKIKEHCSHSRLEARQFELVYSLAETVLELAKQFEECCEKDEDESDEHTSFGEWVKTSESYPPVDTPVLTCLRGKIWLCTRCSNTNVITSLGDYWCFFPPLPEEEE